MSTPISVRSAVQRSSIQKDAAVRRLLAAREEFRLRAEALERARKDLLVADRELLRLGDDSAG